MKPVRVKKLIGKTFKTQNGIFKVMQQDLCAPNSYWCRLISGTYSDYNIGEETSFLDSKIRILINKK